MGRQQRRQAARGPWAPAERGRHRGAGTGRGPVAGTGQSGSTEHCKRSPRLPGSRCVLSTHLGQCCNAGAYRCTQPLCCKPVSCKASERSSFSWGACSLLRSSDVCPAPLSRWGLTQASPVAGNWAALTFAFSSCPASWPDHHGGQPDLLSSQGLSEARQGHGSPIRVGGRDAGTPISMLAVPRNSSGEATMLLYTAESGLSPEGSSNPIKNSQGLRACRSADFLFSFVAPLLPACLVPSAAGLGSLTEDGLQFEV